MLVRGIDMAASWVVSSDNWHQLGPAAVGLARPRHLTPGQFSSPIQSAAPCSWRGNDSVLTTTDAASFISKPVASTVVRLQMTIWRARLARGSGHQVTMGHGWIADRPLIASVKGLSTSEVTVLLFIRLSEIRTDRMDDDDSEEGFGRLT